MHEPKEPVEVALFGDVALARRLEHAQAALNTAFAESLARVHPGSSARAYSPASGGVTVIVPGFQPLSQAVGLGLNGPVSDLEFDEIEARFREAKLESRIILSPLAHASLLELLAARRYRIVELENLLIRPLDEEERFPSPPTNLVVRRAVPAEVDNVAEIVARGFAEGADPSPEMCRIFSASAAAEKFGCYGVWLDGRAVAGGVSGIHTGVLSLSGASTLPEFRRRGAQQALTNRRLVDAAKAGCDVAMITTQPGSGSQRNAERIGFRPLYTKAALHRAWE